MIYESGFSGSEPGPYFVKYMVTHRDEKFLAWWIMSRKLKFQNQDFILGGCQQREIILRCKYPQEGNLAWDCFSFLTGPLTQKEI